MTRTTRAVPDAGHRWRLVDVDGRPLMDGRRYRSGQAAHRAADGRAHAARRAAERAELTAALNAWAHGAAFTAAMDQLCLEVGMAGGRVSADAVRGVLADLGLELPAGATPAAVAALWRRVPLGRRR